MRKINESKKETLRISYSVGNCKISLAYRNLYKPFGSFSSFELGKEDIA